MHVSRFYEVNLVNMCGNGSLNKLIYRVKVMAYLPLLFLTNSFLFNPSHLTKIKLLNFFLVNSYEKRHLIDIIRNHAVEKIEFITNYFSIRCMSNIYLHSASKRRYWLFFKRKSWQVSPNPSQPTWSHVNNKYTT